MRSNKSLKISDPELCFVMFAFCLPGFGLLPLWQALFAPQPVQWQIDLLKKSDYSAHELDTGGHKIVCVSHIVRVSRWSNISWLEIQTQTLK
jgi:hypothetical protein